MAKNGQNCRKIRYLISGTLLRAVRPLSLTGIDTFYTEFRIFRTPFLMDAFKISYLAKNCQKLPKMKKNSISHQRNFIGIPSLNYGKKKTQDEIKFDIWPAVLHDKIFMKIHDAVNKFSDIDSDNKKPHSILNVEIRFTMRNARDSCPLFR